MTKLRRIALWIWGTPLVALQGSLLDTLQSLMTGCCVTLRNASSEPWNYSLSEHIGGPVEEGSYLENLSQAGLKRFWCGESCLWGTRQWVPLWPSTLARSRQDSKARATALYLPQDVIRKPQSSWISNVQRSPCLQCRGIRNVCINMI